MKVISFFSAKGGTGKTTFNMLFASWLAYEKGKRILFLDFDGPEYNAAFCRERELGSDEPSDSLYPIWKVENRSLEKIKALSAQLRQIQDDVDYVIMDFPGSFETEDAVCRLSRAKVLDAVIIPVEMDSMIIASSKALAQVFQAAGQKALLFFNRVHGKEKPELYAALRTWFSENGINISQNRVRTSLAMRRDCESDASIFCRSSICFPDKNIRATNPKIIELFNEVIDYVDDTQTEASPD